MDTGSREIVQTAAALMGGIAAGILLLFSGAAYGGTQLSATPTGAALAAATAACNRAYNHDKPPLLKGSPVLAVARGAYIAQVYVEGTKAYHCISNGKSDGTGVGAAGVVTSTGSPGPDQLGSPLFGGGGSAPGFPGSARGQQAVVQYYLGRAGKSVSAVAFVFAHGTRVDATVSNGWYFAWWLGNGGFFSDAPRSVRVTTPSRTITSPMPGTGSHVCSKDCVWARTR